MSAGTTAAEAAKALDDLGRVMEKLRALLEEETALVRAGRVRNAATLGPVKAELAAQVFAGNEWLKAHAKFLLQAAPARCAALKTMQEAFRAELQKNMIVLATAHAVSEGIVRRLSGDLARKTSPQVYGASGRTAATNAKAGRPLAVSRVL